MPNSEKTPSSIKDVESGSVNDASHEVAFDPNVVGSLKRKADFILLPILAVAYLFNSLDRSNLSNAHTAGLEDDLGLVGNQFNQVLTYYQIPFVVLGPFVTMSTKIIGARISITIMLLVFGAASLATGFVTDFKQLVICRVFVGAFEAGFLASCMFYLSLWYTRKELATRIGIFYASLVSASAFGGLLSFGMFQLTPGKYYTWSYLFFLEGSITMFWAILIFLGLPSSTQSAWWLNKAEKEIAQLRLEQDSVQSLESKFAWGEAFLEFRSLHGYIRVVLSFLSGIVLTSNANFLAMVVRRLGYGTVKTNLYTVAPALTGAALLVIWCRLSDHFRERGLHSAAAIIVSLVSYIILMTVSTNSMGVLYFAMFLCTIGAYPNTPIGSAWTMANVPNLNARALLGGVTIAAGNCGGFVSSNVYISQEAPRYITSLRVNVAVCSISFALCVLYTLWMRWENRRRDRLQSRSHGSVYVTEGVASTKDPRFRFQV
ncbi:Retrograde regulation protein 2 [Pleurostoma richardsiae]|uniref:Retrograde regulation protein 2 n=1 Tax=Pleurostoma richardsiae TaxID=41990 RepID=A0AA38VKE6_9PEZI|nr:Retrograde regulation protein 2 [Pleurostoma richardsiae]